MLQYLICSILYDKSEVKNEDRCISQLEHFVFVLWTYDNVKELGAKKQCKLKDGVDYDLKTGLGKPRGKEMKYVIFHIQVIVHFTLRWNDMTAKNLGLHLQCRVQPLCQYPQI